MSRLKSNIDKDYKSKGHKSLSSFKKVEINKRVIDLYKSKLSLLKDFDLDTEFGYLFLDGDNIVGFVACNNWGWITDIQVTNDYKGYGIGDQLLNYAMVNMGGNRLGVHSDNEVAYNLYKKKGFREVDAKSIGGSEEKGMIFMTTDKSVKEDYIEEKNVASSVAYKMASHMAASAPVLVGNLSAEEKLIRSIVTDDKLSDKEKISKLKKYKTRLKAGKTYRENRGNFIPGVDKAIKHKVYDKLFKDVDDAIKELGGTVEEAVEDITLEGKDLEEILNIIEEETILQEKNDGKDAEYVDKINKIMKKVESSNLKDISKSDLVELDKNIKAIKDNHKKADIILLVLVGLSGGLVGAFAAPLYPAVLATILYIETLINFGVIENKNADPEMSRVAHNIHRAFIINSEKIDKLNKLEDPSYEEIETLKELKKYNAKLAGLDQKLKRANYFNMKESVEEVKDEKHYLYESINSKSLNEIII